MAEYERFKAECQRVWEARVTDGRRLRGKRLTEDQRGEISEWPVTAAQREELTQAVIGTPSAPLGRRLAALANPITRRVVTVIDEPERATG